MCIYTEQWLCTYVSWQSFNKQTKAEKFPQCLSACICFAEDLVINSQYKNSSSHLSGTPVPGNQTSPWVPEMCVCVIQLRCRENITMHIHMQK